MNSDKEKCERLHDIYCYLIAHFVLAQKHAIQEQKFAHIVKKLPTNILKSQLLKKGFFQIPFIKSHYSVNF